MLIQDREIAEIWDSGLKGELLDPIDAQRFFNLCQSDLWNSVVSYERYLAIGREDSAIATAGTVYLYIEGNIGYKECWDDYGKEITRMGFGFFVEAVERRRI